MLEKAKKTIRDGESDKLAYVGIHDLFMEGDWVTVLGESLYLTGFTTWSKDALYSNKGADIQNCGALTNKGGLDDVYCLSSFAFFCEIPEHCST